MKSVVGKWLVIILLIVLAWTAFEKGKPWVEEHGVYGLVKATGTNLVKAWHGSVNWVMAGEKQFEKDHQELLCGKKGC